MVGSGTLRGWLAQAGSRADRKGGGALPPIPNYCHPNLVSTFYRYDSVGSILFWLLRLAERGGGAIKISAGEIYAGTKSLGA